MRITSIILNLIVLIVLTSLITENGWPTQSLDENLMLILCFITPSVSMVALLCEVKSMRITGIILNLILLIVAIALTVEGGWPQSSEEQLMVIIFIVAPSFSLVALWRAKYNDSESWLSLFLERKKLEEKVKLEKLRNTDA